MRKSMENPDITAYIWMEKKSNVSDEEVEEIRKYLEEMDEYNEEIRQIKKR